MRILFPNSSQKYANKAVLLQNLGILVLFTKFFSRFFFFFCTKLCNKTNSRTEISNMIIVFSNSTLKIHKSDMFGPRCKNFYFTPNVGIRQIWGRWFQIRQWLFRTAVRKYSNKAVFVLNVSIFCFCMNLRRLKNSRVVISKMTIVFLKFKQKNTQIRTFFENSKVWVDLILLSRT